MAAEQKRENVADQWRQRGVPSERIARWTSQGGDCQPFGDLRGEPDVFGLIGSPVLSKGRYRRTRGPTTDAFDDVVAKAYAAVRINLDLGR